MSYAAIIDTSAYSEMYRGNKKVKTAMKKAELIVVTPILTGEVSIGFLGGTRQKENFDYLDSFINDTGILWVDIDLDTADRYAIIWQALKAKGTPVPVNDVWLAALAWQHGYKILTLDEHFKKIPQVMLAIDI